MANDSPSKLMKFRVNPHNQTAMKAVITEVGSDNAVMSVDRQEFKNT